jgi:hypothetical protein
MNQVLSILTEGMPADTRENFTKRAQILVKQLHYFSGKSDPKILRAKKAGWSVARLEVVMVLNAFYQTVLAPLASSARPDGHTFFRDIDLVYGDSLLVDRAWRANVREADGAFLQLVFELEIQKSFLIAQRTEDVLFYASRLASDD